MSDETNQPKKKQRWFPLESNPSLINGYVQKLGFQGLTHEFVDILSTEEWALQMVPQPVAAVLFLYPLTEKQLAAQAIEKEDVVAAADNKDIWFTKQRIGNACGTIGLLHTMLNLPADVKSANLLPDSWLSKFQSDTPIATTTPIEKAERLESDSKIATLHDEATSSEENQTSRGNIEDKVETHFIALIHFNGILYELDGRKEGPVAHGPTSPETLLIDACKVIQTKFMARDPTELRFSMAALAPKAE